MRLEPKDLSYPTPAAARRSAAHRSGTVAFLLALLVSTLPACDSAALLSGPDAPTLAYPANGDQDLGNAIELQWNLSSGAETYHLQVSADPGFSTLVANESGLTSSALAVYDLEIGRTYHWRVCGANLDGEGPWSEARSFKVAHVAVVPAFPDLVFPAPDAQNQPQSILFRWAASTGASTYHLQVSLESNFIRRSADLENVRTTFQRIDHLVPTYIYYWRVRAINAVGKSSWSPTRVLVIEDEAL